MDIHVQILRRIIILLLVSPKQSDLINDNYVSPEYGSVNYDAPKVDKIETIEGLEKSLVKIADNLSQKFKEDLKSKNLSRVGYLPWCNLSSK
jgi:hypothetical protein